MKQYDPYIIEAYSSFYKGMDGVVEDITSYFGISEDSVDTIRFTEYCYAFDNDKRVNNDMFYNDDIYLYRSKM